MKIIYTRHAQNKFQDLAELGIIVSIRRVHSIVKKPLDIDHESDYPNKIATGILDKNHILQVVYKEENDIITIITFYPGRKGRYL